MPEYKVDDGELSQLAGELIEAHHPELKEIRVAYLFRDKSPLHGEGCRVIGQAFRMDSRNQLLHGFQGMIVISEDVWRLPNCLPEFKAALMDHELSHIGVEKDKHGNSHVVMVPHNIAEFNHILGRYGCWKPDLAAFLKAFIRSRWMTEQAELFIDRDEPGGAEAVRAIKNAAAK